MKWNNLSLHKIKWICSFIVVLLPFFCSISNIFLLYQQYFSEIFSRDFMGDYDVDV